MKTLLTTLLALLVIPISVTFAQDVPPMPETPKPAPFYGVMAGTMIGVNDFAKVSGGLQVGTQFSIDQNKGLSLRMLYTKAKWGDLDFSSFQIAPMLSWYAGKKWDFYVMVGGTAWQNGEESDDDYFLGFGTSRRIYTSTDQAYLIPLTIDAFADFTSDDASSIYENATSLTIGVKFSRPVKK